MYIELDLEKIKKNAKLKENKNIRFRSYPKEMDMRSKKIDSVVHKIYQEVTEQIDCTKCANCCNTKKPTLDDKDIKSFLASFDIKEEEFQE